MAKRKNASTAPPPPPGWEDIKRGQVVSVPLVEVAPDTYKPQLEAVEVAETETATVTRGMFSIRLPFQRLVWTHLPRSLMRHDVKLTREQAETWRSVCEGLQQQEATLKNGKPVARIMDAIRYVGENCEVAE